MFLTRDRGKKRGVAKGARRARSRYIGRARADDAGRGGVLTSASSAIWSGSTTSSCTRSPLSARVRARRSGHVGYFAELIDEWAPEAHADERLYRLGSSMVDAIAGGAPVEPLARYFEYWLLRLQGVYPSIRQCPGCGGDV